ncbi:magnesium/cobalt transporter CorA [uncultured Dokdonia sp.]|uniref:magnesium/cobalt transporter CorA n=1 Tax=uncultured Dokdonia sp. TaxID=575653 RepID=UPI002626887A|nr:magnesium/cobalt transporter CorA [uncultured Dokdonia sp.]
MAKKHRIKTGMAPGSVVYTGNKQVDDIIIHHLQFNADTIKDSTIHKDKFLKITLEPDYIDWIDIRGMQETDVISSIATHFKVHPLLQESIVDVHQRPNFEEHDNAIFVTFKALSFDKTTLSVHREHVAVIIRDHSLITFQETRSDLFEAVRKRTADSKSRVRKRGTDYLLFALLDSIVDNYYITLDQFEEVIEDIEDRISEDQSNVDKSKIHRLKKELLVLRKSIAPLREVISNFSRSDNTIIQENTHIFIRNLYENTIQIIDSVDSYRDMLNSLQDLFIAELSFKMNKVMQLLTLISVIFIPLTFLAGIYGMNFSYIPELQYKYGYFILLGVMFCLFVILLIFFKRKKWM